MATHSLAIRIIIPIFKNNYSRIIPIFLLREFHGERSLAGYSSWGHKKSNTTEVTEHKGGRNTERGKARINLVE